MRVHLRIGGVLLLLLAISTPDSAVAGTTCPVYVVPSYYTQTYYYTPIYYRLSPAYAAAPGCATIALPTPPAPTAAPRLAIPQPAPPSKTPPPIEATAPPKTKPAESPPIVKETRTPPVEQAAKKPPGEASAKDRCRVGFWNVSGKELVVTVDGKSQKLPANRSITLNVGREFTWSSGSRPPRTERVPEDRLVHEIILRE